MREKSAGPHFRGGRVERRSDELDKLLQSAQEIFVVVGFSNKCVQTINAFVIRRVIKGDPALARILAKHNFIPMNGMNFRGKTRNSAAAKIGPSRFRGHENSR